MNRPTTRPLRVAVAVILTVATTLLAACSSTPTGLTPTGSTPTGSATTHQARLNPALHDLLPQAVKDRGVVLVGTDASYAPMSAYGRDGRTIIGMEPDLGVEIGRVLGVRLQFVATDFSELLADVGRGDPDLAMSAMTDTPERAKIADFVNYFTAGTSIVVQRGNPDGVTELNDLCGKVVAVESDTVQVDLLTRTQSNCGIHRIIVKAYPTNSDALLELRTGRAVAVLNDLPPAIFLVNDARTSLRPPCSTSRGCTASSSPRASPACVTPSRAPSRSCCAAASIQTSLPGGTSKPVPYSRSPSTRIGERPMRPMW
jgi:polar amino acid transport system substrate-binding protein